MNESLNWFQVTKACLTGGNGLLWRMEYEELTKKFTKVNRRRGAVTEGMCCIVDVRSTSFQTNESSANKVEVRAVLKVFETLLSQTSNLYTGSCSIAHLFFHIETAVLSAS